MASHDLDLDIDAPMTPVNTRRSERHGTDKIQGLNFTSFKISSSQHILSLA